MRRVSLLRMTGGAASVALITFFSVSASAQPYPAKPIRVIVPSGAGGSVDTLARLVGQKMSASLGQQVVVENRSGSGGVIGTEIAARSAPDGYTLLMAYGSHVVNPTLYPKLPYDTIKDFLPITQVAVQPLLVNVHPALPAKSIKELVALAKARPGQLNYGSAGSGSGGHLATEIQCTKAHVTMTHGPSKGSAAAMFDVVAGHTQLMVVTLITSLPQVRSGKLRAIGITSAKRSPIVPDVPAVAETIPGYDVEVSYFLLAPAGTPRDIVTKLNAEATRALKQPDVVERLARDGATPVGNTPEQTARYIDQEIVKWGKAVKASGAKEQ
ncbi:MAG: tripartite tricarboxylate transporter substrate binding protein [Betaproteobacteria bacterium]